MKFFIDHIFICLVDMFFSRQFAQIQLRIIHTYTQKMTVSGVDNELYEKRDDFKFPVVNFPFICSNIPEDLNMECILYLSADMIFSELMFPIRMLTWKLLKSELMVSNVKVEITLL